MVSKKNKLVVLIVVITVVISSIVIYHYGIYLPAKEKKEHMELIHRSMFNYEHEVLKNADILYEKYLDDEKAMGFYWNLTFFEPLIKKQIPILKEKINILTKNVTYRNYLDAEQQYQLCKTIHSPFSENYTQYFKIINEEGYRDVIYHEDYLSWGDPDFYIYIEDDYDSDHKEGKEIRLYHDLLKTTEGILRFLEKKI